MWELSFQGKEEQSLLGRILTCIQQTLPIVTASRWRGSTELQLTVQIWFFWPMNLWKIYEKHWGVANRFLYFGSLGGRLSSCAIPIWMILVSFHVLLYSLKEDSGTLLSLLVLDSSMFILSVFLNSLSWAGWPLDPVLGRRRKTNS